MKIKPAFTVTGNFVDKWFYLRGANGRIQDCMRLSKYPLVAIKREFKNETSDCTVRAFSVASKMSYKDSHFLAEAAGRKQGRGFWTGRILKEAEKRGLLTFTESRMYDGSRVIKDGYYSYSNRISPYPTLGQVLPLLQKGRYVLESKSHALAVIDGVIYDQGSVAKTRYRIHTIFEITG